MLLKILIAYCLLFTQSLIAVPKDLPGIPWFKGSVKEAFNQAKKKNTPLFLYWGAKWCPPCNQIKKTIFTQNQFKQEVKNFIPVYLDGDTKRAQIWGEKLKSSGYPTIMIFTPKGEEITRITSGINVNRFVQVMQKSRANLVSMENIIKKGLNNKLTLDQWKILANYSWGQNKILTDSLLSQDQAYQSYLKLWKNIPSSLALEKSQLYMQMIIKKIETEQTISSSDLDGFDKILKDREKFRVNLEIITYESDSLIENLIYYKNYKASKRWELMQKRISELENTKEVSLDEKLMLLLPGIYYDQFSKKEVSQQTKEKVTKRIQMISSSTSDGFTRQAIMSTAIWILKKIDRLDLAKSYAQEEIKKSIAPYYFMSVLASIEKDNGNLKEYINLKKQAWNSSQGPATRFQWGSSYLTTLLKEDAQNTLEIQSSFQKVIKELFDHHSNVQGRNKKRMERLVENLNTWKKNKPNDYQKMKTTLTSICQKTVHQKACQKHWIKNL